MVLLAWPGRHTGWSASIRARRRVLASINWACAPAHRQLAGASEGAIYDRSRARIARRGAEGPVYHDADAGGVHVRVEKATMIPSAISRDGKDTTHPRPPNGLVPLT